MINHESEADFHILKKKIIRQGLCTLIEMKKQLSAEVMSLRNSI